MTGSLIFFISNALFNTHRFGFVIHKYQWNCNAIWQKIDRSRRFRQWTKTRVESQCQSWADRWWLHHRRRGRRQWSLLPVSGQKEEIYQQEHVRSGHKPNFILFTFSRSRIGVQQCFFNKHTISRLASTVVDGVLRPLRLSQHTWRRPCISVVPEATHKASRGPEKGAVSAQKALQGSETEMRRELLVGTEEKSVSPIKGHWFALSRQIHDFSWKRKQKKNWVSE